MGLYAAQPSVKRMLYGSKYLNITSPKVFESRFLIGTRMNSGMTCYPFGLTHIPRTQILNALFTIPISGSFS